MNTQQLDGVPVYQPLLTDNEAQSIRDDHCKLASFRESWALRQRERIADGELEDEIEAARRRSPIVSWLVIAGLTALWISLCLVWGR